MDVFRPSCTVPPGGPGIVAGPNIRSTLDILWSCLAVVLLCTWAVLHENVPVQGAAKEFWPRVWLGTYLLLCKTSSFMMALFAPELFTAKALMCLYCAKDVEKQAKGFAGKDHDNVEWTLQHSFLANMGGWAIEFDNSLKTEHSEGSTPSPASASPDEKGGETPLSLLPAIPKTGGDALPEVAAENTSLVHTPPLRLQPRSRPTTPSQLEAQPVGADTSATKPSTKNKKAARHKLDADDSLRQNLQRRLHKHREGMWFIFKIPKVAQGDWQPDDKNKDLIEKVIRTVRPSDLGRHTPGPYFENLMALRSNIWVVDGPQLVLARKLGIIARLPDVTSAVIGDRSKGDWVTKLLAVVQVGWLVFDLCVRWRHGLATTQLEIVTAAFATCSVVTYLLYLSKPKDLATRAHLRATRYPTADDMRKLAARGPTAVYFSRVHLAIGNDCYHYVKTWDITPTLFLGSAVIGMVFASVHFGSWNAVFPTEAEKAGWRICCIGLVALPVPVCLLMLWFQRLERKNGGNGERIEMAFAATKRLLEILYLLARAFIMVEACRSLLYQPNSAFTATWTANAPHL